jgi:hypothetical protein
LIEGTELKLRSKLFISYIVFIIVYAGFILLPVPAAATLAQYKVSVLGLRLIDLTIILIVAAIWFAGFYGYAKLHTYSGLIKGDKDGKQVAKLTKGIFLLVMWLPVSSVISAVLNYFSMKHPGLMPAAIIIKNYVNLLFPLAGFIFISRGARGLSELVRQRPSYLAANAWILSLTYVGLVYYRLVATTYHRADVYHMPIWLILTTLVAPYVYMWSIGLLAVYEIYHYRRKVKGVLYRKSWDFLALGLGWLVLASIILQYVTTLSAHLAHLNIYWILLIVYSLLLLLSVGFVLIAIGTRKLQRIEEA